MNEDEYRRAIAYQRIIAHAYVGTRLDRFCERLGFPLGWWRYPSSPSSPDPHTPKRGTP